MLRLGTESTENKIRGLIQRLPVAVRLKLDWRQDSIDREFKKELEKQKGASKEEIESIINSWHFEKIMLDEDRRSIVSNQLVKKAHRLHVGVPSEDWEDGVQGDRFLTVVGIAKIRDEIEREEKRRRDARAHWVQLLGALTGLIGTLTGLFAVLNK